MSVFDLLKRAVARVDSWFNSETGVGVGAGRTNFQYLGDVRFDDATLEALYFGDPYASRGCNCVPDEALRRGLTISLGDPDWDVAMVNQWRKLTVNAKAIEAWTWARAFGGSVWFIGADDGRDLEEPLDLENIETVRYITVIDKRRATPARYYDDPLNPGNFGEPELYDLQLVGQSTKMIRVHESRIIRWDGAMTTLDRRRANNSWCDSELQRVYSSLQQFNGAFASVSTLLQDASQGVFSIDDLYGMLAADTDDTFRKRMTFMNRTRSAANVILLDKNREAFSRVDVSGLTGGLPSVLDKYMSHMAGAWQIPVTVLMGQAPAGENATGNNDLRWFYDRMDTARLNYLDPRFLALAIIFCAAKDGPTGGEIPDSITMTYPSMWSTTPTEDADIRLKQAQADAAYANARILYPTEIAESRFRKQGYSTATQLDPKLREGENALAKLEEKYAALKASHTGLKNMFAHVLERNRRGELVKGSPLAKTVATEADLVEQLTGDAPPSVGT